jgi:hypothetical protein
MLSHNKNNNVNFSFSEYEKKYIYIYGYDLWGIISSCTRNIAPFHPPCLNPIVDISVYFTIILDGLVT